MARVTGVVLEWRVDPDPSHRRFECYAFPADGTLAASIADVPDPTPEQRRVLEAQVALEAIGGAWQPVGVVAELEAFYLVLGFAAGFVFVGSTAPPPPPGFVALLRMSTFVETAARSRPGRLLRAPLRFFVAFLHRRPRRL